MSSCWHLEVYKYDIDVGKCIYRTPFSPNLSLQDVNIWLYIFIYFLVLPSISLDLLTCCFSSSCKS